MHPLKYDLPVIVDHNAQKLAGRLSISRTPDFWCGTCFVSPDLWIDMEQHATARNGGFGAEKTHGQFLLQVALVFAFRGGCFFDFADNSRTPIDRVLH